ncbi:hypothetical protein KP509_1Z001700 [Ceratopteris richardii]|nr:hypothetical protein KP509_1Z001700 [Ceratopteris richardii]
MGLSREKGRTFTLDLGSDGATSLQKVVLKKLTEFMGDYSDDVLAQYIVVLVAHGKQQAQAIKDLEAFLGDQSEAFVAWLWDYLSTNLHLHTPVSKTIALGSNGVEHKVHEAEPGRVRTVQADVQVSPLEDKNGEKKKQTLIDVNKIPDSDITYPRRRNPDTIQDRKKAESREKQSGKHYGKKVQLPQDTCLQNLKERPSEMKQPSKRHSSPVNVNATRRLLQSAVREAVGPVAGLTKPGSKRLRSVVSTELDDNEYKHVDSVDHVREENASLAIVSTCTQAPASASVSDHEGLSGSVWDRLGRRAQYSKGLMDPYPIRKEGIRSINKNTHMDDERSDRKLLKVHHSRISANDLDTQIGTGAEKSCQSVYYHTFEAKPSVTDDMYSQHHVGKAAKETTIIESAVCENRNKDSRRVSCVNGPVRDMEPEPSGPQNIASTMGTPLQTDGTTKHPCMQVQELSSCQLEQLQANSVGPEIDNNRSVLEMKKRLDQIQMEMKKLRARQADLNKDAPHSNSSTVLGTDEVVKKQESLQSRTVYVTNVHFAATKDSIMAHFSQFGKVEQVVMVTDTSTGKSKGSVYVQFSTSSDAERALGLNGTSFFSRILKVLHADSTKIQDMLSSIRHPSAVISRSSRGQFFGGSVNSSGFSSVRAAYPSLMKSQWKRGAMATGGSFLVANGAKPVSQGSQTRLKSFTYVRNSTASTKKEGSSEGHKEAP